MVNTVSFINPEHTLVKVEPEGWQVPQPCNTWHQEKITQWEEGRTDEWDAQKAAYDNYQAIMSYESDVTAYYQCLLDNPLNLEVCIMPVKPHGYFTQEEVDAYTVAKAAWDTCELQFPGECGKEPSIKQRPADLTPVSAPPALVSNSIAPWKTDAELILHNKAQARQAINIDRDNQYNTMTVDFVKDGITYVIDVHEKGRAELNSAVTNILLSRSLSIPDALITWTTADDQDIDFTYDEITQIAKLALDKYSSIHKASRLAKAAL